MKNHTTQILLLCACLCAAPAWAASKKATPGPASDPAAESQAKPDKCAKHPYCKEMKS